MYMYIRRILDAKRRQDEGATAVEYGLMVAAIAAVIVLIVFALGAFVKGAFKKTCNSISSGAPLTVTGQNCNG